MKVIILTPIVHFQSPLVLRELFGRPSGVEIDFLVLLTPKLSSSKRSPASISRIVRDSGWTYLVLMVLLKVKFDFFRFMEALFGKSPGERRFMTPAEACDAFGVRHKRIENVNADEAADLISDFGPDIIVALFFNQILKRKTLALAGKACVNLHPSPLPEYRGMSPVLWMLADGRERGGATLHYMDEGIDSGDVVAQRSIPIKDDDGYYSLYRRAALTGADLLVRFLSDAARTRALPNGKPIDRNATKVYGPITREATRRILKRHSLLKLSYD